VVTIEGWRRDNLSRVFASQSSTAALRPTATNFPHGDQVVHLTPDVAPTLAVHKSHEVGAPVTIFDTGVQIIFPYNFLTTDEEGARKSAEW